MSDEQIVKKFMYVNRKSPYGTIYALESLEVVLISAAFDQDVSLTFTDDGVYQLMKNQQTDGIGMKNFSSTYSALGDYEIKKIFIDKESLDERGLSLSDLQELVWEDEDEDYAEKSSINLVTRAELSEIMNQQDVVLSFLVGEINMNMLHTINKSPFENSTASSCLKLCAKDSSILFIEDGVISVMKSTKFSETIENALKEFKMYVLKPDLEARGLPLNNVIEGVEIVGYEEFVDLTTEHKTVQSWL